VLNEPVNLVDPSGLLLGALLRPLFRLGGQSTLEAVVAGKGFDAVVGLVNSVAQAFGQGIDIGSVVTSFLDSSDCSEDGDAINSLVDLSGAFGARTLAQGALPTALAGGTFAVGLSVVSAGAAGFEFGSAVRSGVRAATGFDLGTAPADALAGRLGL
jgi:hypothetical protein